MTLTEDEKEYLLSILEYRIADHEGLKEKREYLICKKLIEKIEKS
jgi:hypothetical protein